jgi:hypothetical protein
MASKKSSKSTKRLKKAKQLEATKPLSISEIVVTKHTGVASS